jgi:hypothetical protein
VAGRKRLIWFGEEHVVIGGVLFRLVPTGRSRRQCPKCGRKFWPIGRDDQIYDTPECRHAANQVAYRARKREGE